MNILLPLSRFQVEYEIGAGRPYSELDKLVLRAIAEEEATTVDALKDIFRLPSRLLLEILVTLAKAGWIAVSTEPGNNFAMTPQGHTALNLEKVPDFLEVRRQVGYVLMECVTGKLIPQNQIKYDSQKQLEKPKDKLENQNDKLENQKDKTWDRAHKMPVNFFENRLDEGQVRHLLPLGQNEWIRWIGTPVMTSRDWYWLLVDVNLEDNTIFGLPERWRGSLQNLLLEEAAEVARRDPSLAKESTESIPKKPQGDRTDETSSAYSTQIELDDLLLTHREHVQQLEAALAQAKSTVLIASAFLNTACLEPDVRGWLLNALERGVDVDLLWGYAAGHDDKSTKEALRWLKDVRKDAGTSIGKLRFNEAPTDSHAKLLIYDTDAGYQAYVGSYNWLSTPTDLATANPIQGSNVTVCLHHPGLVADLCRSVADLWVTGKGNSKSDAPVRWRRLAGELEQKALKLNSKAASADLPDSQCQVSIVRDREHENLMREWLLKAETRCAVVSHKIGAKAPIRLASLEKRSYKLVVRYAESSLSSEEQTALRHKVEEANGGELLQKQEFHSKVVVVDNTAIVSSYNFLSADPFNNAKNAREVGILIEGGILPKQLWQIFGT